MAYVERPETEVDQKKVNAAVRIRLTLDRMYGVVSKRKDKLKHDLTRLVDSMNFYELKQYNQRIA